MAYFTRIRSYDAESDVLHVPHGYRTARSAVLDKKFVSANKQQLFELPAGMFIARTKDSNGNSVFRPLPHAKVIVATTTSSPRFKVEQPYSLISGDQLFIVEPYATLTVASTAVGSLAYAGQVFTYTPTGAANAIEAAAKWAEYLNNTSLVNRFRFSSDADKLYVFENNLMSTSTLTPTGSLGSGGVTTALNTTSVGTVASIDTTTEEVVLNANAGVVVPVGFIVGTKVDDIYGIYIHTIAFNDYRTSMDVALGHECQLKLSRLPFWGNYIQHTYLPRVEARDKY